MKAKNLLFIILCALAWGPAYLFIKIAVVQIPPPTLVFLRVAISFIILYLICLLQKNTFFNWKQQWKQYVILGISLNAIPFYLVSFGELYISSSLAGILYSFTLIFTALLSHFFGKHDPLTKSKILGIVLGIIGLTVIYLPIVLHESIRNKMGVLMVVLACLSTAIGSVYARTHLKNKTSGLIILTAQLGITALILFPIALIFDQPYQLPLPSFDAIASIFGLGIICTVVAYFLYYKAIRMAGPTYASFSVLLLPVFAMFLGHFILHEHLTNNIYIGTALILSGVLAVNPVFEKA